MKIDELYNVYMYYSRELVELVGLVADIEESNDNKRRVAIVVDPVSHTGRQGNDITFSDFPNLLVLLV